MATAVTVRSRRTASLSSRAPVDSSAPDHGSRIRDPAEGGFRLPRAPRGCRRSGEGRRGPAQRVRAPRQLGGPAPPATGARHRLTATGKTSAGRSPPRPLDGNRASDGRGSRPPPARGQATSRASRRTRIASSARQGRTSTSTSAIGRSATLLVVEERERSALEDQRVDARLPSRRLDGSRRPPEEQLVLGPGHPDEPAHPSVGGIVANLSPRFACASGRSRISARSTSSNGPAPATLPGGEGLLPGSRQA